MFLYVITIFPVLQWISVLHFFIISFPDFLTLETYSGTLYLRGGTYSSLGFISIHIYGITTANAMALAYEQVSLTLLLGGTSNPAHLFLLQAMPIWESRTVCTDEKYEMEFQAITYNLSQVLADTFEFKESNDAEVSQLTIYQRSEEDNIMTSPVKVQISLSFTQSFAGGSDMRSRGWSGIQRATHPKSFACTMAKKLSLTAFSSICLLWKTVVFAAAFRFIFSKVLARPTGL